MKHLETLDLGLKDYKETLDIQYDLLKKRIDKEISDTLIFVEHPHVITVGRKSDLNNILDKTLPIYHIERGGDVTYHGQGQIVCYPIIDISETKNVIAFIRNLEEVIIHTLKSYNLDSERKENYTGVWIDGKKIASIGISFKRWVSYHGLALNVSNDLNYFFKINPCGLNPNLMTSLEKVLGKEINLNKVKDILFESFIKVFNYN